MSEHFSTSAVSYAGALLTAETGVETPSQASRRIKKTEGSSEDNSFAIQGDNGFKNEDYRCGGPGLVRLPTLNEILKPNEPLHILYHEELVGSLRDILEKWNVDSRFIHLVRRYHARDSPESSMECIVVSAKKHKLDDSWLNACREIRDLFLEHGRDIKAKLGGSLGMQGKSTSSFTFGGFLELQFHRNHQWKRFGLTNFHFMTNDHYLDDWKSQGIMPGDSRNHLTIDHPSRGDYNKSIKHYEKEASSIRTQEYYETKKRMENKDPSLSRIKVANFKHDTDLMNGYIRMARLANEFYLEGCQYLGKVYAASGYRITPSNRLLDWALKEVERDRTGFTEGRLGALHVTDLQSWSKNPDGSWNKVRGSLHEIFPVAPRGTFGDPPGDSGDIMMDRNGSFVGLYVGGFLESGTGYFMEAKDLFEDIRAITGATDVKVP
ncbi:Trypsin-like cysteine/serine peptidase domain [Trichophyton rubrum]|nr:Trypsin-like cysteine/serine peptidase domain [Trichophyton rubrum]